MNKKDNDNYFIYVIVFFVLLTSGLSLINSAFISAFLFMGALLTFAICYSLKDDKNNKKKIIILFSVGVLMVLLGLIYMIVRII